MQFPTYKNELKKLADGFEFVAGCDEVGVGPVAGPVVAAACILKPETIKGNRTKSKWFYRVRDSKTVNEAEREALVDEIKLHCLAYGIGEVQPAVIDAINIHNASLLAMKLAVQEMLANFTGSKSKIYLFLDGRFQIKDFAEENLVQEAVIDGDASILSISAASIIAKVHRDAILKGIDAAFPGYGFAKHKGYNTKEHSEAIKKFGITEHHRKSFLKDLIKV